MKKLLTLLLFITTLIPAVKAQEDTVDMNLSIYRWSFSNTMKIPDLETGRVSHSGQTSGNMELWYQSDGQWRELNISAGQRTKKLNYKGPRKLIFHNRSFDAEGKPVYKENCSVVLPLNASESFLLMFKQGNTAKFYPMNVSPQSLPKEKLAVMNMTIHPVGIQAGGDSTVMKSGAFLILTPKKRDQGNLEIKLAKYDTNMKKWRQVYDNSVTVAEDKRSLMLIYDPYNAKSPKFTIQILTL